MLELFHYLHVIFAVIWGGGSILFSWVILPTLVQLEPTARHEALTTMAKIAGPVMITAAVLTLVGGIGRVLVSGSVSSLADLTHGYGLVALIALILVIAWAAFDERGRTGLMKASADGDTGEFARLARRDKLVTTSVLLVVLGLMGALRLGHY